MNQKKFEKVWRNSENIHEVCKKMKITHQSAYYWARKFGLPTFCGTGSGNDENSPTEKEIAERAAEIRAGWSDSEEQSRIVGRARRVRYEIPSYEARSTGSKSVAFVGAVA
jgi:hypothetical protein